MRSEFTDPDPGGRLITNPLDPDSQHRKKLPTFMKLWHGFKEVELFNVRVFMVN